MSVLLPKFNNNEIIFLQSVAESFTTHRSEILELWKIEYKKNMREDDLKKSSYLILREAFELLLDDFITFLSAKDLIGYLNANANLVRKISRGMDLDFKEFMHGFQFFEVACNGFINTNALSIPDPYMIIDKLHYYSIGEINEGISDLEDITSFSIMSLVEFKDPETSGHIARTREYSKAIARELGTNDEFIRNMHKASSFHDLGKIGIPDGILLKPARLDENEFALMMSHTTKGAEAIEKIIDHLKVSKGYLVTAKEIAEYHHEKWDGTGYFGLSRERIPLSARIFTLADVYDALRSKRPYKEGISHEEVVSIIMTGDNRSSPAHFDPDILAAFEQLSGVFEKISNNLNVCDHWEVSRNQLWGELSRGLDLKGTKGYRKMGCYECEGGLNVACNAYMDVFSRRKS